MRGHTGRAMREGPCVRGRAWRARYFSLRAGGRRANLALLADELVRVCAHDFLGDHGVDGGVVEAGLGEDFASVLA